MSSPQWLELPMSRTNLHGQKLVQAIDVQLYKNLEQVLGSARDKYLGREFGVCTHDIAPDDRCLDN